MGKPKKTHEEYVSEIERINPNVEVLESYINYKTKIKHRCKVDGHQWMTLPANILNGSGCPICRDRLLRDNRIKPHEKYIESIKQLKPNIEVVDQYMGAKTKILHRCKVDGYEWMVQPTSILSGGGCPVCAGQQIGPAPEYKNSIWASEYKEYCSRYMSEEQMKTLMPMTHQKIDCICQNCHTHKTIIVSNLIRQGLDCVCGDGQSFPNKFVYNILKQLKVNVKPECRFEWSDNKRYDDYLVDYNIIIENHGLQHYEETTLTYHTTLKEIQLNDIYKEYLAFRNGIQEYIILDCRKSNADYIKNSILNSRLPSILHFTEADIDWNEAYRYACTNITEYAIDLYNCGSKPKDIASQIHINVETVRKWIREASSLGLCKSNSRKRPVYCIELKQEYAIDNNISSNDIIKCIKGIKKFAGISSDGIKLHWEYINI